MDIHEVDTRNYLATLEDLKLGMEENSNVAMHVSIFEHSILTLSLAQ